MGIGMTTPRSSALMSSIPYKPRLGTSVEKGSRRPCGANNQRSRVPLEHEGKQTSRLVNREALVRLPEQRPTINASGQFGWYSMVGRQFEEVL